MTPLVLMILTSERDMRAQQEQDRLREEAKINTSTPRPKQKISKRFFFRTRSQEPCKCS